MMGADFLTSGRRAVDTCRPESLQLFYGAISPGHLIFFCSPRHSAFSGFLRFWTGFNFVLVVDFIRKLKQNRWKWAWLGFAPVLFIMMAGQIDIVFLWLASLMPSRGWKAAYWRAAHS